jgi:hypothetical protein
MTKKTIKQAHSALSIVEPLTASGIYREPKRRHVVDRYFSIWYPKFELMDEWDFGRGIFISLVRKDLFKIGKKTVWY